MSEPTNQDLPKDLPDGQELEEYLRGGSAVSRQYRQLRSDDVPPELDRLVMRQAQEAVKTRPAKSRAWLRWSGPLALAASAVLVVSIVIESGVHKEETYLNAPVASQEAAEAPAFRAADDVTSSDAGSAANVVPIIPTDPGAPPPMVLPPAPVVPAPAPAFVPEPAPLSATQPESPAMKVESAPPEVERRVEQISRRNAVQPVPTPARARDMNNESRDLDEAIVTSQRRQVGDQEAARAVQDSLRDQSRIAGPRNTVPAPARSSSQTAAQANEARTYTDPEDWLDAIRELRKENKHEDADREWLRFRYVYPNYSVADDDPARRAVP